MFCRTVHVFKGIVFRPQQANAMDNIPPREHVWRGMTQFHLGRQQGGVLNGQGWVWTFL